MTKKPPLEINGVGFVHHSESHGFDIDIQIVDKCLTIYLENDSDWAPDVYLDATYSKESTMELYEALKYFMEKE